MDLTSYYLRAFLGAKGVRSPELDSLAQKMGALHLLSHNPLDRYLITRTKNFTALSMGNKVVFGRSYYDQLTDEQRLAVSAHELAHIIDGDNNRWKVAWSMSAVSSVLMAASFIAFHSLLLAESVFCLSFLGAMWVLSSREAQNGWQQELRCDNLAACFVGGDPMIASLRLAESMQKRRPRRNLLRRSANIRRSSVEDRISAINALNQSGPSDPVVPQRAATFPKV